MQSERRWTEESAEVGRKSLRPKITRRVGSTKIARAVGPWAIFGEPERPKPRSRADGATMLQLIQQEIHSSAIPGVCKYAIACESKIFLLDSRFAGALLQIHHPGFALLRPRDRRSRIISLYAFTYLPGRIRRNSPQNTWAHKCESVFVNPRVLDSQNRVFGFAWIHLCRFVWIRYGFAARIHGYAEL